MTNSELALAISIAYRYFSAHPFIGFLLGMDIGDREMNIITKRDDNRELMVSEVYLDNELIWTNPEI